MNALLVGFLKSDWVKATASLVLGWALTEFSHRLGDRRERKKAIARALADLLEIRIRFIGAELVIRELGTMFPISPLEQVQARALFQNLFGDWSQLAQRYNESVSTLASVAPVLAYQLRSKESGQQIFQLVDSAAASTQPEIVEAHSIWKQQLSPKLLQIIADTLTGTCLHIAWRHSLITLWKVRGLVKRNSDLPSEVKEQLAVVKKMVLEHQKKQAGSEPQQPPETA